MLYAARRDEVGNRLRSRSWLDLVDLSDGRWLVYATGGRDDRTVNAVAATPALITTGLTDLL